MPNKHLLKRIICFIISLSMCSGLYGALPAYAGDAQEEIKTQTITVCDDTYLRNSDKDGNYDSAVDMTFHQNGSQAVFVRFDLTQLNIPDGYKIDSAVCSMNINSVWGGSCKTEYAVSLYKLSSSLYDSDVITYNNRTSTYNITYGDVIGTQTCSGDGTTAWTGKVSFDIAGDYLKAQLKGEEYAAFALRTATSSVGGNVDSREKSGGTPATLTVTYKKIAPPVVSLSRGTEDKTVDLEWEKDAEATGYEVYMGDTAGNTTLMSIQPVITPNGTKMQTTVTVSQYGVPYYFTVAAVYDGSMRVMSNEVSTPPYFEYEGASVADGCDNHNVLTKKVELIYNNEIGTVQTADITVKKNGTLLTGGYSFDTEGNKLIITFSALEFETTYSIAVSDDITDWFSQAPLTEASLSFKTISEGLISDVPVITKTAEGFTATANVYNPYDTEKSAALVLSVYDENNAMLSMESQALPIASGDEKPFTVSTGSGYCAKAFVVDNMTDMNLLCPQFAEYTQSGSVPPASVSSGTQSVSIESLSADGFDLAMQGSVSPAAVKAVLIRMKDEGGVLKAVNPIYTESDGSFTYSYVFPDALADGVYTLLISGKNLSNTDSRTVNYKNPERELVSLVNSAASEAGVAAAIQPRTAVLGLDGAYLNQNGYDILFEQKPFAQISDVKQTLTSAKTILDSINASDWSSLGGVILANETILSHNSSGYSYYKGLTETERNKINQPIKVTGNYSTIKLFRSSLDNAVAAYIDDNTPSYTPSGGGGGGGGGKKVSYDVEVKVENEAVTEESGFEYPDEVLWAKDSIEYLYKNGIVSGDGNGNFRPLDNITREEFVKLLVEALGIEKNADECTFTDASRDAWYVSFLAAAQKAGIVRGTPDGHFGVGQAITRQDIVVMSHRAVSALAKELKETHAAAVFTDEAAISDYAKASVEAMQKSGIIAGVGDNLFAPTQNANRAQAAKIIYNLILSVKGGI